MAERRAFSVAVYPRHRGRVLLIRHRRLGVWLPPGGECEAGETPLEAARRELREETGLDGTFPIVSDIDGTPPGLIGYEEHVAGSKGRHLNFVFVVDVATDAVAPNDEFEEWRWVSSWEGLDAPKNVGQLAAVALAARAIAAPVGAAVTGAAATGHAAEASPRTTTDRPLVAIAERWLDRFNARDLDGLLALYADDAVHTSPKLRAAQPETDGKIAGKEALRAWWADSFRRLPSLRYDAIAITADAGTSGRAFMEYVRRLDGAPDLTVAEVLVVREELIRESAVYHG